MAITAKTSRGKRMGMGRRRRRKRGGRRRRLERGKRRQRVGGRRECGGGYLQRMIQQTRFRTGKMWAAVGGRYIAWWS
jgi:hypothetical protein